MPVVRKPTEPLSHSTPALVPFSAVWRYGTTASEDTFRRPVDVFGSAIRALIRELSGRTRTRKCRQNVGKSTRALQSASVR